MPGLPTGTVTFLFTDIEGSTRLLQQLGDRYADALTQYRRLLRSTVQERGGQEVDTQGDAFFCVFPRAGDAVAAAAVAAQAAMLRHPWPDDQPVRARMGLHTGEPVRTDTGYVGLDVHRAARIGVAGHGGQILLSDATHGLVAKDLPREITLRDLGEHRLKDLGHPQRLFEIVAVGLPTDFPHLRSLDVLPNNLPRQLTSFIGREKEMAEVKRLLSTACLVTLTGPGGAGKTRLALQVAADLLDQYPDGVWFVELAPLSDPALVAKAVASALDVPEQPGRQLHETLVRALPTKHLLLVLDNCEHVLAACRDLADTLLRACPHLRILATSRAAAEVDGEVTYRVPSLQLPDLRRPPPPATLAEYEAIRLFAERAALSEPGFALAASNATSVAQICHRLDGIPLAIEFAAARVKVLSVNQIAARLDDRFRLLTAGARKTLPRHQTLRATMDWSYDLLLEQEQAVLRRLSVFAGGWTLEAAEAICSGDGVEASDILDLLTRLVDKSLVSAETRDGEARYRLLETVRQYGRDKLHEAGETGDVRRRHGDWYLQLAEAGAPALRGPEQKTWADRLEREHDNFRAALQWSTAEPGGAETGARLAGSLWWFWYVGGHGREGRKWLEAALATSAEAPPAALPAALLGAAFFAFQQNDYECAARLGKQGLAVCRRVGDRDTMAELLIWLGMAAARTGDYERAIALLQDGLTVARDLGNKWITGLALGHLGNVARAQGDCDRATALHAESLAWSRDVGYGSHIAFNLGNLGNDALQQNDYARAGKYFTDGLKLSQQLGHRSFTRDFLEGAAGVACGQGRYERAARLFGAADALRETLGDHRSLSAQATFERRIASTRKGLGDSTFDTAWAQGRAMTLEQAIEYALADQPG